MKLRRLLPLLLLAACARHPAASDVEPGDVVLTAWVDLSAPSPAPNVRIQVRNDADRVIYVVDHCGDQMVPQLERRQGEQWVPASADLGACLAVVTPPIRLAPGETVSRSVALHEAGHYRSTVRATAGSTGRIIQVQGEFAVGP